MPNAIWEEASIDFIMSLPMSGGKTTILVVVIRLSKNAHFAPLSILFLSRSVAQVFIESLVRLHGLLKVLISDHDLVFLGHFWRTLFKAYGMKLYCLTVYHPQLVNQMRWSTTAYTSILGSSSWINLKLGPNSFISQSIAIIHTTIPQRRCHPLRKCTIDDPLH